VCDKKATGGSSHPEIQEYYHTIVNVSESADGSEISPEEEKQIHQFVELTIRNEGFKATPYSPDDIVHFQELVDTPSTKQGSVEGSKILALACETQTLGNPIATYNGKNLFRVCLVNEQGERVLDTLVKPQVAEVAVKGGTKQALMKYAELKAESYEAVRERVLKLIEGRSLVAYHLPQKMSDLGILKEKQGDQPLYDVAKIFNCDNQPGVQVPITTLCERYLNLCYKKRPSIGQAFTDAKISMALFK